MKTSQVFALSAYNTAHWAWQADGTVVITLVDTNTGKGGTMRWRSDAHGLKELLEDSDMEVKR